MDKVIRIMDDNEISVTEMSATGKARHTISYSVFHDGAFVSTGEAYSNSTFWAIESIKQTFVGYRLEGVAYDMFLRDRAREDRIHNIRLSDKMNAEESSAFEKIARDYIPSYELRYLESIGYDVNCGPESFISANCTEAAREARAAIKAAKQREEEKKDVVTSLLRLLILAVVIIVIFFMAS